ncbi:hypothetical protein K1X76_06730 [bacterium]|nr:hypothetical protein [bacterium]
MVERTGDWVLTDPTPNTPLQLADYEHPLNQNSPFRVAGVTYEDFSSSWLSTFHDMYVTPPRVEQFLGWWLVQNEDEIKAHYPTLDDGINFSQWEGSWQLSSLTPSYQILPSTQPYNPNDYPVRLGVDEAEVYAEMVPDGPERADIPYAGGLVSVEYDQKSRVCLHAQITGGHLQSATKTTLVTFENTYVSVDSADVLEAIFGNNFIPHDSLLLFQDLTKRFTRLLQLESLVVVDGRIKLIIKPNINPLFGSYFPQTLSLDLSMFLKGHGVLGQIAKAGLSDTTTDVDFWEDAYREGSLGGGQGLINQLLPSCYRIGLWSRHVKADVNVDSSSLISRLATEDGRFKLLTSSCGSVEIEASVPIAINWNGKIINGHIDTRLMSDDQINFGGWCEFYFDEVPLDFPFDTYGQLYWKNIVLENNAWDAGSIFSKILFTFEGSLSLYGKSPHFITGGGVFAVNGDESRLTVQALSQGRDETIPRLASASVNLSEQDIDFTLKGMRLEILKDVWVTLEEVTGHSKKEKDDVTTTIHGVFKIESKNSLLFDETIRYQGTVVYDIKHQTLQFKNLNLPLRNINFSLQSNGNTKSFVFNGRVVGSPIFDLTKKELRGPLVLKGNLLSPNSNLPFFPAWVAMQDDFTLKARFEGVLEPPMHGDILEGSSHAGYTSINNMSLSLNRLWQEEGKIKIEMDVKASPAGYTETPEEQEDILEPEDNTDPLEVQPASPYIVREAEQSLNDWDVFLSDYGLDEEKARMMLDVSQHIRDGSFTLTGFSFTRKRLGALTVPAGCEPVLDIRVHNGKLMQFHFYFTRPLLFGAVKAVRGIYFDHDTGSFRLDLVDPSDGRRPINMYQTKESDLKITRLLFKMLPLPDSVVAHLLEESKLDPDFLNDSTKGWLQFFFMALVAMGNPLTNRNSEEDKKESPLNWGHAVININSLQLDEGARFKYGGAFFEFGCAHGNSPHDAMDANNSITGKISLADGSIELKMATIGKLHMSAPLGNDNTPAFDIILEDGDHGTLTLTGTDNESTISIDGFTFRRASIMGSAKGGHVNISEARDIKINTLQIIKSECDTGENTTLVTDFDFNLARGSLDFSKGNKEAHLEMENSPVHLKAEISLENVYGDANDEFGDGFAEHRKSPMVFTIFKKGTWEVSSPSLYFPRATFTPDMEFENSSLNHAFVRLEESAEMVPSMDIEGEFDWHMQKPITLRLAATPVMQKLNPKLVLNRVDFSGAGHLVFTGNHFHFEPMGQAPLLLHVAGEVGMHISSNHGESEFTSHFDNTQQITSGDLAIGANHGSLPLFIEKLVLDQTAINLQDGHGVFYVTTPTGAGYSEVRFTNATGNLQFEDGVLERSNTLVVNGLSLQVNDHGPHRNKLNLSGAVVVNADGLRFSRIAISGRAYDEQNQASVSNLSLESRPQ